MSPIEDSRRCQARIRVLLLITGIAVALLPRLSLAQGAFNGFLQLDKVPGESVDPAHRGWIDIYSISNSVVLPISLYGSGRPTFSDITVSKLVDKASPSLLLACATADPYRTARIQLTQPAGACLRFYEITLGNVIVARVANAGDTQSTAAKPAETLDLHYTEISWSYIELNKQGLPVAEHSAWYDLVRGVGGAAESNFTYFRVTASRAGPGMVRLTWPGTAGITYQVRGAPQLAGPYAVVSEVPVSTNGIVSCVLPTSAAMQFFTIGKRG